MSSRRNSVRIAVIVALLMVQSVTVEGAELIWDGNGAMPLAGGAGTWNDTLARWHDGNAFVPWIASSAASFSTAGYVPGSTTTQTAITLGSSVTARGLSFYAPYKLDGAAANAVLDLSSSGVGGPGPQTIYVADQTKATLINARLAANSLIKTGGGTFEVYRFADGFGGVTIHEGTFGLMPFVSGNLSAGILNGPLAGTGDFAIGNGRSVVLAAPGTFSGRTLLTGAVTIMDSAALGTSTIIVPASSSAALTAGASSLRVPNPAEIAAGATLNVRPVWPSGVMDLDGAISGTGKLTFVRDFNLPFSNSNPSVFRVNNSSTTFAGALSVANGDVTLAPGFPTPVTGISIGTSPGGDTDHARLRMTGTINLPIGTAAGQINFESGYYSINSQTIVDRAIVAAGGDLDINFGGAATPAAVSFAQTGFWKDRRMSLGSENDSTTLRFYNPLNLAQASPTTAAEINVTSGRVEMHGAITGLGTMRKVGVGTLALMAASSYFGSTELRAGVLEIHRADALPASTSLIVSASGSGATFRVADGVRARVPTISLVNTSFTSYLLIDSIGTGVAEMNQNLRVAFDPTVYGVIRLGGTVDMGADRRFEIVNGILQFNGKLLATGSVAVDGSPTGDSRNVVFNPGSRTELQGPFSISRTYLSLMEDSEGPAGAPTRSPFGQGELVLDDVTLTTNGKTIRNNVRLDGPVRTDELDVTGQLTLGADDALQPSGASPYGVRWTVGSLASTTDSRGLRLATRGTLFVTGPSTYAGTIDISSTDSSGMSVVVGHPEALGMRDAATTTVRSNGLVLIPLNGVLDANVVLLGGSLEGNVGATFLGDLQVGAGGGSIASYPSPTNGFELHGTIRETVTGAAGRLTLQSDVTVDRLRVGAVTIYTSGPENAVCLRDVGTGAALSVSRVRELVMNDANSTLDLTRNPLVVDYASPAWPLSQLTAWIKSARGVDGNWTGPGITSSLATVSPDRFSVGIGQSSALASLRVGDLTLDSTSILLRLAYRGDADLDGNVDFDDLLRLSQHYQQTGMLWTDGDFNYDGRVDFDDLLRLAQNYGGSLVSSGLATSDVATLGEKCATDFALAMSLAPEPSALALLALATPVFFRRRCLIR